MVSLSQSSRFSCLTAIGKGVIDQILNAHEIFNLNHIVVIFIISSIILRATADHIRGRLFKL